MYTATTLKVTFTYQSQNLALVSVLLDFQVQYILICYQQNFFKL